MQFNGFDANQVDPNVAYEPLPAGWYKAVITTSEEKPTKAQTGSYLQLSLEVIEGPMQGRKLTDRLNLNNPNATATEIAFRTLSAICHAVGIMTPRTSSDLHDKPLMVKVKVKPADGQYSASNEVAGYEAVGKTTTQETVSAGASSGASGGATPPWKRK
jgi:hypothetical protein